MDAQSMILTYGSFISNKNRCLSYLLSNSATEKNKNKQKKGEHHLIASKKAAPPASEQNSPRNVLF